MARSRRTPSMFIGRCFWELSGRKLQRTIKKSQTPSAPGFPLHSSHRCRLCGSPQREPHAVVRSRNSRQEIRGSRPVPACRGGTATQHASDTEWKTRVPSPRPTRVTLPPSMLPRGSPASTSNNRLFRARLASGEHLRSPMLRPNYFNAESMTSAV